MSDYTADQLTAIQGVLDRVTSYQDGAPQGTVEDELRAGLADAELDLPGDDVTKLAAAVENAHGAVEAAAVLS